MFHFSFRRMVKNRWLTISLLIGYMMAVAVVCSMPVYSSAVLNRLLTKDLQQVQTDKNVYPGQMIISKNLASGDAGSYRSYDATIKENILPELDLPILAESTVTSVQNLQIVRADDEVKYGVSCNAVASTGLFDHITLLSGSLPQSRGDGVVEVVMSEAALRALNCVQGGAYTLFSTSYMKPPEEVLTVKVVGVFTATDTTELFWVTPFTTFSNAVVIDPAEFEKHFVDGESPRINAVQWSYAVDYTQMNAGNAGNVAAVLGKYNPDSGFLPTIKAAFSGILEAYGERSRQLSESLWIIEIPILLLLVFYIFMVSRLILSHEKNEIAVLRSRGASQAQVTKVYTYQSVFLSAVALIVGPLLSLLFCRMIGAANGFMEFVNRKGMQVSLSFSALGFGCAAAGALVLTMLCSVLFDRRDSIVALKRKKSRRSAMPLWQKLGLDFICLAVSLYGYYTFQTRLQVIRQTGAAASDIPVDFLLYASSTLFMLGATLLFLRIFPLLVKLIYWLGRRFWNSVLYLTLLNISRTSQNQMISLFLIFTLSMGVFNAVTARTLNRNDEDRIRYSVGADVSLQESWPYTDPDNPMMPIENVQVDEKKVFFNEPRFSKYQNMKTVQSAARVLTKKSVTVYSDSGQELSKKAVVMGIVPDEFGKTCWSRADLLPHHINEYLNLLATQPRAALLSGSLMEKNKIKPGDIVNLLINGQPVSVVAYAGVDYFPSFNPVGEGEEEPALVVANLVYLQQEIKLTPYAVWLKKAPGVTSAELYDELSGMGLNLLSLEDANAQVTDLKNDFMTQGLNGFFTLSFLVTMLITFVGFFIYWILAIKSRLLQFGILRSMGLSRLSVIMVLLWEQILVSVTSILAGLGLGTLAAALFAPVLECNVDAAERMIPFLVTASPGDYLRIIVIVAVMLALATAVLSRIIYRLRASEALKLGED